MLLLSGMCAAGDVYKEVDANGNVVYSDRPREAAAQRLDIDSAETDQEAIAARRDALEAARVKRQQAQEEETARKAHKQDLAAQREANCEKARAYQQRVETAHRLYEVDDNGDRNYYSAEQHDAALARARDQVREWCGSQGS